MRVNWEDDDADWRTDGGWMGVIEEWVPMEIDAG